MQQTTRSPLVVTKPFEGSSCSGWRPSPPSFHRRVHRVAVAEGLPTHARLSETRGTDPATSYLRESQGKHWVEDAEFLVDGMGYLTALAQTDLSGHLDYTERNIVKKLFQTFMMRIGRFSKPGTAVS